MIRVRRYEIIKLGLDGGEGDGGEGLRAEGRRDGERETEREREGAPALEAMGRSKVRRRRGPRGDREGAGG